jgi:HSP20 family protein
MGFRQFEPLRAMRDLDRKASQLLSNARLPHWVPADAWREGQAYQVEIDLPGVDPASIDVHVEPSTVTVTAERRTTLATEGGPERSVLAAERPVGPYSRRIALGEGLDLDAVEARYADGVLHLRVPLASASRPRRVKVEGTSTARPSAEQPAVEQPDAQQQGGDQQGGDQQSGDQPGGGETHAHGAAPEPTGEAGRSEGQTYDPSI